MRNIKKTFTPQNSLAPNKMGSIVALSALTVSALLLQACGNTQYNSIATTSSSTAPGSFTIAPKVDVIVVEDDTGSMFEPYATIQSELSTFVSSLDQQNWNYHFGIVPLTTQQTFSQALASKQDLNWGSYYTAPYSGAPNSVSELDTLNTNIFTTLTNYSGLSFPIYDGYVSNVNNSLNGAEPGFITVADAFNTKIPANSNNFLRNDAMLAVIFVGNGNDTSYVNYCFTAQATQVPCEQVISTACPSGQTLIQDYHDINTANGATAASRASWNSSQCLTGTLSLNYFEAQLAKVNINTKAYAAVASETYRNSAGCNGGYSTVGTRYQQVAARFGGSAFDVCNTPLTDILTNIQSDLTTTVLNYVADYAVVSKTTAPDPTTITVQEYVNGDTSNPVTIPEDSVNGWSYDGWDTQYMIYKPVNGDQETGYLIKLNGTAQMTGTTTAFITYKGTNGVAGTN